MYWFIFNVKKRAFYSASIVHFFELIQTFVSMSGTEGSKGLFLEVKRLLLGKVIYYLPFLQLSPCLPCTWHKHNSLVLSESHPGSP
jgi:hypothetical protein